MRKVGGGIAENVARGRNDFTFELLPDFSCFWFGPRGPERCFLLGDLLPLIMVQEERCALTFPSEKGGLEFQAIFGNMGHSTMLGFLTSSRHEKPKQILAVTEGEKKLLALETSLFFSQESRKQSSVWLVSFSEDRRILHNTHFLQD